MFWELYLRVQKNKEAKVKALGRTLDLLILLVAISNCSAERIVEEKGSEFVRSREYSS